MTLCAGIDLGKHGALAVVESSGRRLWHLWDMPTFEKRQGKGTRTVIDPQKLQGYIQGLANIGVKLVTIEAPWFKGGQQGQGAIGWGAGLVVMACIAADPPIRYEMAAANAWKSSLKVSGPKSYSIRRAQELFPANKSWFEGPRGGAMDGRAEAALICEYGIRRHLGEQR